VVRTATVIRASGDVVTVSPASPKGQFTLEELCSLTGSEYIEVVRLPGGRYMVCDEEGKLRGRPVNSVATTEAGTALFADDHIVGDVLVCDSGMIG
jgi:hypothetical protein